MAAAALVGTNIVMVYYVLSINVLFGVVALVIALAARLGPDGQACAQAQPYRATYLIVQFVPLILLVFQSFHVLLYMRMRGVVNLNDDMDQESEDDD